MTSARNFHYYIDDEVDEEVGEHSQENGRKREEFLPDQEKSGNFKWIFQKFR
jgi:hypothetical protein